MNNEMNADPRLMAQAISRQGGQIAALHDALLGLLRALRPYPEICAVVDNQLERGIAAMLATSINPHYSQALEDTALLAQLAMAPDEPAGVAHGRDLQEVTA